MSHSATSRSFNTFHRSFDSNGYSLFDIEEKKPPSKLPIVEIVAEPFVPGATNMDLTRVINYFEMNKEYIYKTNEEHRDIEVISLHDQQLNGQQVIRWDGTLTKSTYLYEFQVTGLHKSATYAVGLRFNSDPHYFYDYDTDEKLLVPCIPEPKKTSTMEIRQGYMMGEMLMKNNIDFNGIQFSGCFSAMATRKGDNVILMNQHRMWTPVLSIYILNQMGKIILLNEYQFPNLSFVSRNPTEYYQFKELPPISKESEKIINEIDWKREEDIERRNRLSRSFNHLNLPVPPEVHDYKKEEKIAERRAKYRMGLVNAIRTEQQSFYGRYSNDKVQEGMDQEELQ
ncbi:Protein CBG26077 [Caenorhabditis briggsae]|uniref:Protein CBG26077 n=1 Tax=Caenorhabditis briggsae TaxID=6238 RepID=B6IJI7_CAEBR|nr:Protein CBG26077 [Caenorhabditis briggsae]CAS00067.1 Protein CBG26077 [Caenorhabditis briggsae]